jgi:hypothetical protein
MPYKYPEELKEVSHELGAEDPTLVAADKTGGGFDEDEINEQYHPVSVGDKTLVRDKKSTLDWKNYRFEATFEDGTRQEFPFTAPDDGAAQKAVAERKSLVHSQNGSYKLVEIPTPKELETGDLGPKTKTIDESEDSAEEKSTKRTGKAQKAAARDKAPTADAAPARSDSSEK